MSKDWHLGHFSCWQCDESLTGQRYVLRDEHPYCVKCYETVFANNCDDCNRVIGIDSKVSASLFFFAFFFSHFSVRKEFFFLISFYFTFTINLSSSVSGTVRAYLRIQSILFKSGPDSGCWVEKEKAVWMTQRSIWRLLSNDDLFFFFFLYVFLLFRDPMGNVCAFFYRICRTRIAIGTKPASCATSAACRWSTSSSALRPTRFSAARATTRCTQLAATDVAKSSAPVHTYYLPK